MKRLILLATLSLLSLFTSAQEIEWKELELDQIEKHLQSKDPSIKAKATYHFGKKLPKEQMDKKMELYQSAYVQFEKLKDYEFYYNAGSQLISGFITQGKLDDAKNIITSNEKQSYNNEQKEGQAKLWDRYVNYITRTGNKVLYENSLSEFHTFLTAQPSDKGWYLYYKREGSSSYMFGDMLGAGASFEKALPFIPKEDEKEKAGLMMNIGIIKYKNGMLDEALSQFKVSAKVFEEAADNLNAGHAYINVVSVYLDKAQHDSVNQAVDIAMKYYEKAEDSSSMYNALEYKALVAQNEQEPDVALNYHLQILEYRKSVNDERKMAMSYMNIASIYKTMKDYEQQLNFIKKAGAIGLKRQDGSAVASYYSAMANYFVSQEQADSALHYAENYLDLVTNQKNPRRIIGANLTIGNIYKKNFNQPQKALEYYIVAYDLAVQLNIESEIAGLGHNIGVIYEENGEYKKAKKYIDASFAIRKKMDNKNFLMDSYHTLSNVYSGLGLYKESNQFLWEYVDLKDSLYSDEMKEKIAEMRTLYETQQFEDSLQISQQKEQNAVLSNEKITAENKRKSEQIYWLIGILILAAVAIFIAFRSSQQRKATNVKLKANNEEILMQKEMIEEKNKDIMASITYAKRIQTAILPPKKLVKEYLNESFIYYLPKDVVAGDFYWMEPTENGVLFAAADCTGHGVPGAMVSVVCNNGLNRSVREYGLKEPGKILDKTREIVIQEFEKSEEEVKDGMDVALCSLEGKTLKFAGAHNPLWIIRKDGDEVEEIKANKQPIGKFDNPEAYTTHTVELNEGDSFYVFSDGFADQFGGDKGKKFKSSKFKKLLLSIQQENMISQRDLIHSAFDEWKGEIEQLDDVCVIGVRV